MADRWAFIVATDRHLDPALGTTPYAESGAKALSDALATAGYPKDRQVALLGQHATKAVVESRLRKLKKALKRGDEVLAFFAGRGFSKTAGGSNLLACWDTQPDDLQETALTLESFVTALTASKAGQVVIFIDVGRPPGVADPQAEWEPHHDAGEFADLLDQSPKAVALRSCDDWQGSHESAALKASLWAHLVTEAVAGRAAKALDKDGRVTALSLHRFIEDELPRLLRKHFDAGASQFPMLFGEQNAAAVIADLSARDAGAGFLLDPDRLRRVVFRAESTVRVKDLTAWRKTYDLPEAAGPSSRKFVARVANPDVKTDLDLVYEAARQALGYRRKDVTVETGPDGFGCVRTPDFEYTVTASLDPDDPTRVAWRREAGGFADPAFVRGPDFAAVFGKLFDALAFEFRSPVDVEELVDRLEDRPPKGAKVQVASDGSSCDILLAGFAGRVTVDRHSLTVRGRAGNAAGLLDQLLAFLSAVGPLGEPLMLPPSK